MKYSILSLILLSIFGLSANASLKLDNVSSDWTVHMVKPGSKDAAFTANADAVINYHEIDHSPEASMFVHTFPAPAQKLGNDVEAWHRVVFNLPGRNKPIPVHEGVIKVGDEYRYIIHFQLNNGSMLNTVAMATIVNGKLVVFAIEQHRNLIAPMLKSITKLYKTVKISEITDDSQ